MVKRIALNAIPITTIDKSYLYKIFPSGQFVKGHEPKQ